MVIHWSRQGHLCAGIDFKMQSHLTGRSGMVMLQTGTVGSGFTCVPAEMAVNIFLGVCVCIISFYVRNRVCENCDRATSYEPSTGLMM